MDGIKREMSPWLKQWMMEIDNAGQDREEVNKFREMKKMEPLEMQEALHALTDIKLDIIRLCDRLKTFFGDDDEKIFK